MAPAIILETPIVGTRTAFAEDLGLAVDHERNSGVFESKRVNLLCLGSDFVYDIQMLSVIEAIGASAMLPTLDVVSETRTMKTQTFAFGTTAA